jgi:hypothetical protein
MSCPIMLNTDQSTCTPVPALSNECYPSSGGGGPTVFFYGDPITYGLAGVFYSEG